jgi:Uma2 family endonuclease
MSLIRVDRKTQFNPNDGRLIFTYNDISNIDQWPEGPLLELTNGVLYMVPSPSTTHQIILQKLNYILYNYVTENSLGIILPAPVDVKLSDKDVVVPDIIYLNNDKKRLITENYIDGSPSLVIEIMSLNRSRDLIEKRELYQSFGIKEYLIVDIKESMVYQLVLSGRGVYTETHYRSSDLLKLNELPLSIDLSKIFEIDK